MSWPLLSPVTLLVVLAGAVLAHTALRAAGVRGWTLFGYTAGLAPGIGFGTASLLLFDMCAVGLPPPGVMTYLLVVGALMGGTWILGAHTPPAGPSAAVPPARRRPRRIEIAAALLLACTLVGVGWTYRATAASLPEGVWDAVSMWNVRARFLHRAEERVPQLFNELDPRRGHPDYPLMVPGAVAAQWFLAGEESPREPRATALAFVLGLGVLAFVVAGRAGGPAVGAVASGVVLSSPALLQWGFGQGADVAVAYYLLAALAVLSAPFRDRAAAVGLGGVLLGLLAWTKNEATVFALILAALFVAWEWRSRRRARSWIWLAAGFAPGVLALAVFKLTWAPTTGVGFFLGLDDLWTRMWIADRWIFPLRELGRRLLTPWSNDRLWELWGPAWPLLGAGAVLALAARRRGAGDGYGLWLGTVVGAVLAVWLVYAITPQPYRWQVQSSLDRFLFQIFPLCVVGLASRLVSRSPWSSSE